jgi:hypothetical protein
LRDVSAAEQNGYPLTFFTEASIDLADDPELMRLMVEGQRHHRLRRYRRPTGVARDQKFRTSARGTPEGPPHQSAGMEVCADDRRFR